MTEAAIEARRRYRREWYAKNKDKHMEYQERYWLKKSREWAEEESCERGITTDKISHK